MSAAFVTCDSDLVAIAERSGDYSGKPRPAAVVQSELFDTLDSVTVCPLTGVDSNAQVVRLRLEPPRATNLDRR